MKETGIVRRMDDLGRIVIPKEIRRAFRLREGDPLEIFIDNNNDTICLKKYIVSYGFINDLDRLKNAIADEVIDYEIQQELIEKVKEMKEIYKNMEERD